MLLPEALTSCVCLRPADCEQTPHPVRLSPAPRCKALALCAGDVPGMARFQTEGRGLETVCQINPRFGSQGWKERRRPRGPPSARCRSRIWFARNVYGMRGLPRQRGAGLALHRAPSGFFLRCILNRASSRPGQTALVRLPLDNLSVWFRGVLQIL